MSRCVWVKEKLLKGLCGKGGTVFAWDGPWPWGSEWQNSRVNGWERKAVPHTFLCWEGSVQGGYTFSTVSLGMKKGPRWCAQKNMSISVGSDTHTNPPVFLYALNPLWKKATFNKQISINWSATSLCDSCKPELASNIHKDPGPAVTAHVLMWPAVRTVGSLPPCSSLPCMLFMMHFLAHAWRPCVCV